MMDALPQTPVRIRLRQEWGDGHAYETLGEFIGCEEYAKNWIVKGAIAWGETSAWVGPPGSMKSALMADLAIAVAFNRGWHGRKTKTIGGGQKIGVCYFALERADLVKRRLEAQMIQLGLSPENGASIVIVPTTIDLADVNSVQKMVRTVKNMESFTDDFIGVIIIDTFAKLIAAGGGDEDKAKDQGKVFANIERLKEALGRPHVALVGHTGKDETRGARGSNAILGDVDVMVTLGGGDIKTATVIKANDMGEGELFSFVGALHEFGVDEDGDPITVNIVSSEVVTQQSHAPKKAEWSRGLKMVHDAIADAILAHGRAHRVAHDGPMVRAVSVQEARQEHQRRYVSNGDGDRTDAERKAWTRNFAEARQRDLISGEVVAGAELIWIVREHQS